MTRATWTRLLLRPAQRKQIQWRPATIAVKNEGEGRCEAVSEGDKGFLLKEPWEDVNALLTKLKIPPSQSPLDALS